MSKILILANDTGTICYFRCELIQRLIGEKHEVILSLPEDERNEELIKIGSSIEITSVSRFGMNPMVEYRLFRDYIHLLKKVKPDIVLTYTVKPNIYGGFACQRCKVPYINNITGLGSTFQRENITKKFMLFLQKGAYKKSQCVFFQNESNKKYFEDKNIVATHSVLLPGSGVNLELNKFEPYPIEENKIRFIFASRIRKDKGFDEFFDVIKLLFNRNKNLEFHIVGGYEDDNYKQKINEVINDYGVIYHGKLPQESVYELMKNCHCLIHPSYHEGMSNVILENAALGRPCLASDIPGCREGVNDNETGILFKPQSSESLYEAILKFTELSYAQRRAMGIAGRKKMEVEFDRNIVIRAYMKEIDSVLGKTSMNI